MPASPNPRNTFEVTVPPVFGQDHSFDFTFHPASPGPVVSACPFAYLLLTRTYQTVKIFMGPPPSSLVPSPRTPSRKLSTPPRVSVGVSPIRIQRTPPRTLVSRGCSPTPLFDLLPPDIAAFFNSTQMQLETTQQSLVPVHSPTRLTDSEVISLTSSESDNDGSFIKRTTRAHSPDIVPETQVVNGFMVDPMVRPRLLIIYDLLT
jgi:hypothetical protein